jgi:hypothetical protein
MGFAATASALDGLSQLLGQEMMPHRIRLVVVQPPMMGFPPFATPSEMDLSTAPPPMEWPVPQFRALYSAPPRRVAGSVAPPRQQPMARPEARYGEPRRPVVEPEYEAEEPDYADRRAYDERPYEDPAFEERAYAQRPQPDGETPGRAEPRQQARRERTASREAQALPCRMLSPDGGFRRVVCWGEFKRALEGRIEHPERLRDSHRLACAIRIYEATAAFRAADLERSLSESEGRGVHLERLTGALVQRLGLAPVLPPPRRPPYVAQRQPGDVLPFERLIELEVAEDPTRQQAAEPATPAAPERSAAASPAEAPPQRGRSIPTRWVNPWEFRLSREEALYDMNQELGWSSRILRALRRAMNTLANRTALRKWQALLNGKPADEQLWAVRPPRIALTHPRTRPWVSQTLAAAGYDPATMLAEWEIFWRRKGV